MAQRFDKYQIDCLMVAFEQSEHPTKKEKIELGSVTGLDVEQVASWFSRTRANKRARESVEELEQTNAGLLQALRESQEREAKLQKELQESKRRETDLTVENHHLRQQLGIGEGDSQFGNLQFEPTLRFWNGW